MCDNVYMYVLSSRLQRNAHIKMDVSKVTLWRVDTGHLINDFRAAIWLAECNATVSWCTVVEFWLIGYDGILQFKLYTVCVKEIFLFAVGTYLGSTWLLSGVL